MRIVIAYRAIDGIAGGVERMSVALMNALSARGHEVHFYTIDRADAVSYYEMDKRITWHKLDMGDYREKATWGLRWRRAIKARRLFQALQPDVILGFQDGAFLSCRAYTAFMGIPVVLAERISPQHFDYTTAGKYRWVFQQLYRFAAAITVQCASYISMYPAFLQRKITAIPNPVFPAENKASPAGLLGERRTLLCVGRIGYQKNQTVLVRAFLELSAEFPDWVLKLAGDGEDSQEIARMANGHAQVEMLGNVKDVGSLYVSSHLYCLPSRWEGFPNSLAEALSHGLPAVGFADCGGVRDLIEDGKSGLLAQEALGQDALRDALATLMRDDARRAEMGAAAVRSMVQYEPEAIFDRWEAFLTGIADR